MSTVAQIASKSLAEKVASQCLALHYISFLNIPHELRFALRGDIFHLSIAVAENMSPQDSSEIQCDSKHCASGALEVRQ